MYVILNIPLECRPREVVPPSDRVSTGLQIGSRDGGGSILKLNKIFTVSGFQVKGNL